MTPDRPGAVRIEPGRLVAPTVLGAAFVLVAAGGVAWGTRRAPSPPAGHGAAPPTVRFWRTTPEPTTAPEARQRPSHPEGPADTWPHEALARVGDPNVLQAGFAAARLEEGGPGEGRPAAAPGPRLAVGGLDPGLTRDLGTVALTLPVTTALTLANVGDAPLTVARVYAGASAITARLDGAEGPALDPAGRLVPPLTLAPGAARELRLTIDPRRLTGVGTRAHYLQLFTDDPRLEALEPGDPTSREARVRLVVETRPLGALARPIGPAEVPLAAGQPRAWLPELAVDGRGGDALDLGEVAPGALERALEVVNLGDAPLRLAVADGDGAVTAHLDAPTLAPGARTRWHLVLAPAAARDDGPFFARTARLRTDDPLAPEIEVRLRGRWAWPTPAPGLIGR